MRRHGWLVTVTVLVVATIVTGWWLLPHVLTRMSQALLGQAGLKAIELDIGRPGLTSITIATFGFTDAETGLSVNLEGVRINYRLTDLVRGDIQSANVSSLMISMASGDPQDAPLSLPVTLPRVDIGAWLARMPADGIRIKRVELLSADKRPVFPAFSVRLTGNSNAALISAKPVSGVAGNRLLEAVLDRAGLNGVLAYDDDQNHVLEWALVMQNEDEPRWRGQVVTEVSRLRTWMAPIYTLDKNIGQCNVDLAVALGENPLDALGIDAALTHCRLPGGSWEQAQLKARFMRTATGIASAAPARVTIDGLKASTVKAGDISLEAGLDIDFNLKQVTIASGARLDSAAVALNDIAVQPFSLELIDPASVSVHEWPSKIRLRMPELAIGWQENTMTARDIQIKWPFGDDAGASLLCELQRVDLASGSYRTHLEPVSLSLDWRGERLAGASRAQLAGKVPIEAELEADYGGDRGRVVITGEPFELGKELESLSSLIDGWPLPGDLVSGRAGFRSVTDWNSTAVSSNVEFNLDHAGGVFDGIYFSDASTDVNLEVYPEVRMHSAAPLSIGIVDYGISASNVTASVALEGIVDDVPIMAVSNLRANLFDGTLFVPGLKTGEATAFELVLTGLDLNRMISDEQFPGLSVNGRVSGRVPVQGTGEGLTIVEGKIDNDSDGRIHYNAGDAGAGSGAEILFKALKEFEFTRLAIEPQYRTDGTLLLKVHMEGTSEEIGRQQPVHFNINLEQNLLSLMESIRLVNGLNDRIDQRVQQHYENLSPQ